MTMPIRYLLGYPVDTEVGQIVPIKVRDFEKISEDFSYLRMDKKFIVYQYLKIKEKQNTKEIQDVIDALLEMSLYEIVNGLEDFQQAYSRVFEKVFVDIGDIGNINPENFVSLRKTILEMNCATEESAYINLDKEAPAFLKTELQKVMERSARVKAKERKDESPELEDMVSSVVVGAGFDYKTIAEWSMYQLTMAFSRISQFKNHDTTTLFATVASGGIEIESWSKRINLFEKDGHSLDEKTFGNNYKDLKQ